MTTLNINNKKYFEPFLKTLEGNTDTNFHTSNGMLIAFNFGTSIQIEEMKEISKNHNDLNFINPITSIARKYLIKDILNNMKDKKLAKRIRVRL